MDGDNIHITGSVEAKVGDIMKSGNVRIDGYMPPRRSFGFRDRPRRYGGNVINKGIQVR